VIALTAKNFDSSLRNGNGKRDRVNSCSNHEFY
jgi:hypothetical protein